MTTDTRLLAPTPEKIDELAGPADYFDRHIFARAIEAEARNQDDALILQLLEALEAAVLQNDCDMVMTGEELRQARSVIALGRARLGGNQ